MERPKLIIGNRNYSSWSLRAWLVLEATGLEFDEVVVPLGETDTREKILRWSPSGRVPALHWDEIVLWDSLAICEHLAERFPGAGLWPDDPSARAMARSVVAEMHSSFTAIRSNMPMNVRASRPDAGRGPGVEEEIERVIDLWENCRRNFGEEGDLLFGKFSIADAFYAPIVSRFLTYGVNPEGAAGVYMKAVEALQAMQAWTEAAHAETATIPKYDE